MDHPEEEEEMKANEERIRLKSSQTHITPGSSNDSILKSIDEDNKSTSSSVSTSSAFEDSTNMYSEKSESSMSSISMLNKVNNEKGTLITKIIESNDDDDDDDALEVLSSYDNDSGNDEFDEKGDGFNNFSYSSSDSRSDKKFCNYFNSLPLMRNKKQCPSIMTPVNNFDSIKRKHFNGSAMEQEPFHDESKVINSPSPSLSWSSDSNMIQQQNLSAKSSSAPMLVRRDQCHEDFNKLTVRY